MRDASTGGGVRCGELCGALRRVCEDEDSKRKRGSRLVSWAHLKRLAAAGAASLLGWSGRGLDRRRGGCPEIFSGTASKLRSSRSRPASVHEVTMPRRKIRSQYWPVSTCEQKGHGFCGAKTDSVKHTATAVSSS